MTNKAEIVKKKGMYEYCEDCMCHYRKGFNHVCPPWLKALVQLKKDKKII